MFNFNSEVFVDPVRSSKLLCIQIIRREFLFYFRVCVCVCVLSQTYLWHWGYDLRIFYNKQNHLKWQSAAHQSSTMQYSRTKINKRSTPLTIGIRNLEFIFYSILFEKLSIFNRSQILFSPAWIDLFVIASTEIVCKQNDKCCQRRRTYFRQWPSSYCHLHGCQLSHVENWNFWLAEHQNTCEKRHIYLSFKTRVRDRKTSDSLLSAPSFFFFVCVNLYGRRQRIVLICSA